MLAESIKKVKEWCEENKTDLYIAAIIFLVGLASFGLGRLSVLWPHKEPIEITNSNEYKTSNNFINSAASSSSSSETQSKGKFVGSKNSTSYHYPWCPGALKIKEENKVWFQTKEEAEAKGYKAASNCPGL